MDSLVTVVIPTYNAAAYVAEAVESALKQSYPNVEVIVVDDGSTDDTKSVLDRFSGRINYIFQENGGVSAARNLGVRSAKGDYIAFLDADDVWKPDKLKRQMVCFKAHPDYGMVTSNVELVDLHGASLGHYDARRSIPFDGNVFLAFLENPILFPSSVVIKRKVLEEVDGFDSSLKTAEDTDLFLRVLPKFPVANVDASLIKYRKISASLSNSLQSNIDHLTLLKKFQANNPDLPERGRKALRQMYYKVNLDYGLNLLWKGHCREARAKFTAALKYRLAFLPLKFYVKSILKQIIQTVFKGSRDG